MVLIRNSLAALAVIGLTAAGPAPAPTPDMPGMPDTAPATQSTGPKLTPEAQLLSPEDRAARRKLGAFIRCINDVAGVVPNLVRPYRDAYRAVSKDPVNGIDQTSYTWMYQSKYLLHGPGTIGKAPIDLCADGLTEAVAKPPADAPLDALGTAYATDLRQLDVLAPKVEAYYNQKDYRDDKMAQGRAFDAEYEPLLKRLLDEGRAMFAETHVREAVLQQRRLDAIERMDGKHLRWQANAFMIQARATLDGLKELVRDKKVSKDAVLAVVTPLETRFAEASAYATAHPEESNDGMNLWTKITGSSYATDLVTAAKQARRDADAPGTIARVSDDAGRMLYLFNTMLDFTNSAKR